MKTTGILKKAAEYAKHNDVEGLPKMAAVIAKRKKILAVGYNKHKTHPMMLKYTDNELRVSIHAEVDALVNALKNYSPEELVGSEIYIARLLKNGKTGIAKPCEICQKALEDHGITSIHWTDY